MSIGQSDENKATPNGCHFDTVTYSQALCSWPNDGIDMTCNYSVPYQITCNLTLSGLTEASSTQVICSSALGENPVFAAANLSIKGNRGACIYIACNLNISFYVYTEVHICYWSYVEGNDASILTMTSLLISNVCIINKFKTNQTEFMLEPL